MRTSALMLLPLAVLALLPACKEATSPAASATASLDPLAASISATSAAT